MAGARDVARLRDRIASVVGSGDISGSRMGREAGDLQGQARDVLDMSISAHPRLDAFGAAPLLDVSH